MARPVGERPGGLRAMAVRRYGSRSNRWRLGGAQFGPFEGGLNLRDSFTDFAGKLCYTHPDNGFTYDGATVVHPTNMPPGRAIAAWQNKLFIAWTGNPSRIYWCAVGDPTSWTATDFNDLREKDDKQITA